MENPAPYHAGPAASAEPPLTITALIALAHAHRDGQDYPTPEPLIANLPVVLHALCDHFLSSQVTALDIACRLASLICAVEGAREPLTPLGRISPESLTGRFSI